MYCLQGFQLGDSELREYTHGMLSSAAKIMGAGFAPWLPAAVEAALKSCALDDGCNGTLEKEDSEPSSGSVSLQSQAESDSELGEEERRFSIYTGPLQQRRKEDPPLLGPQMKGVLIVMTCFMKMLTASSEAQLSWMRRPQPSSH